MNTKLNVNISLPQSEFTILKKLAKALGWNLFVQEKPEELSVSQRKELVDKLYGCVQLPEDFDYKKELELAVEAYNKRDRRYGGLKEE